MEAKGSAKHLSGSEIPKDYLKVSCRNVENSDILVENFVFESISRWWFNDGSSVEKGK